jgi:hypothetical protein
LVETEQSGWSKCIALNEAAHRPGDYEDRLYDVTPLAGAIGWSGAMVRKGRTAAPGAWARRPVLDREIHQCFEQQGLTFSARF